MKFNDLRDLEQIFLYAGDLRGINRRSKPFVGLSIREEAKWWNPFHISHDVTKAMDLPDNCVDIYQSEDVFEHIPKEELIDVINEIYRVLKPGGFFRLSIPDYRSELVYERSRKDEYGIPYFDPGGGGHYDEENKKVTGGGHVWFPLFETTVALLQSTEFTKIEFLHYYDILGRPILRDIDYSQCFVKRTPDYDDRVKDPRMPLSIVVDCFK